MALDVRLFQVVPPCGGHHALYAMKNHDNGVSSRAPVWGASRGERREVRLAQVSSRAPVWGASYPGHGNGGRSVVSSRAPVWGAS